MKHISKMALLFGLLAMPVISISMEEFLEKNQPDDRFVEFVEGEDLLRFNVDKKASVADIKERYRKEKKIGEDKVIKLFYGETELVDDNMILFDRLSSTTTGVGLGVKLSDTSRLQADQPNVLPYPKAMVGVGVGAMATAAAVGALYAGLKWYQKKRIRSVIAKHDLKLTSFSSTQKNAMAAAVLASRKVPVSMLRLRNIVKMGKLGSVAVPSEKMWEILADLYYRKTPTDEDIQKLKERVSL